MILLRPGRGTTARRELGRIWTRLSLELSEEKTRVVRGREERFLFLSFEIAKVRNPKSGKWWRRVVPAKKSEQELRDRLREIMNRRTTYRASEDVVREVNQVLRGWGSYS